MKQFIVFCLCVLSIYACGKPVQTVFATERAKDMPTQWVTAWKGETIYAGNLTWTATPDKAPGEYNLGSIGVKLLDRTLPPPSQWQYFLDLWQHPWAVSRWYNVKPFSPEHYAKMKPLWQMLANAGQKSLTVTLVDLPWNHQCYDGYYSMIGRVKKDDGTWVFDYTLFDQYVEFGRACGIGPDIACYTMCPWEFFVSWKNEKGETIKIKALPGTQEFEEYWGDFLVDFTKHLKAKGWFEDTYIAMDERTPEDVRKIANFIQKKSPGMKIAMAGNRKPSDFAGITIDNYSQLLQFITPDFLAEVKARQEKGYKTTFYVCCSPERPNTFMASHRDEAFYVGVYPALNGLDGLLRWAANSWPKDPYKDASWKDWMPGDTFLIYPHGEPSARFLNLRAGIVAAEKLRILKEQGVITQAQIDALVAKYPVKQAVYGRMDWTAFRREVEALLAQ